MVFVLSSDVSEYYRLAPNEQLWSYIVAGTSCNRWDDDIMAGTSCNRWDDDIMAVTSCNRWDDIMAGTGCNRWDDDDIRFVLDEHT